MVLPLPFVPALQSDIYWLFFLQCYIPCPCKSRCQVLPVSPPATGQQRSPKPNVSKRPFERLYKAGKGLHLLSKQNFLSLEAVCHSK